ncbi:MAG: hypothetical protein ACKVH5_06020 [Fidelibacterota bacterium]|jgi:hypothetical protein
METVNVYNYNQVDILGFYGDYKIQVELEDAIWEGTFKIKKGQENPIKISLN